MGFDGGRLGVVDWWWIVGFGRWVLILILRLMGFDLDYDFFRLIGYVVVDGGCWWLGL